MATLIQVGAGSGGMPVLDLVCRDPRITGLTLIEPDVYQESNVHRHVFPRSAVAGYKADLASRWLQERRPDLSIGLIKGKLQERALAVALEKAVAAADLGICAADNEAAKFHWDGLMRRYRKPWTLGEVLSGGIGGFVHLFVPGGPCYGCVASFLQRSIKEDNSPPPDYSQLGGPVPEVTIPASKAAISTIASLHALLTLELLDDPTGASIGFTSLLWTLKKVPGMFEEAFRPYRFRITRSADCLLCREASSVDPAAEDLDVALDQALARLGDE